MALLQIGGWDDDVHHITIDEPGPGPNERRAMMRRRIAWAAVTLFALVTLVTIIVQVAPTPSIPAESARWATPEVVAPAAERGEPEKMLAGNGIALDTEPIKAAEPDPQSFAENDAPEPARLQINNRGELTMNGTTFDAATTRELGMFLLNTEYLWCPRRSEELL